MAKGRFGLGGGADALLGGADFDDLPMRQNSARIPQGISTDEEGGLWAEISLLKPNPHQPRTEFDPVQLQELADSIREHGILQPITVEDAGDGSFYIITGERRTRAARLAGLEKVPVQLKKFSDEKKLEVALIENIQRSDLNPVEEAKAYYQLMELSGLTQEEVARRVGKNRATVANALRLLKLPSDMLNALSDGKLTAGHARALLSVANDTDQRVLFGRIIGSGISVREAEYFASEANSGGEKKPAKAAPPRDPHIADMERQFVGVLGTKVSIKGTLERGSLQVEFFSKEDLDRLYSIIAGKDGTRGD